MKERILEALGRSRAGYGELRLRRVWSSAVLVRGRGVDRAAARLETGGLARCCSPGTGWGAVEFGDLTRLDSQLLLAHELSLAGASREPVRLAAIPIRQSDLNVGRPGSGDDPRAVSLSVKQELAERLAAALLDADRRVGTGRILVRDEVVETWLGTSEGTWIHDLRSQVEVAVVAVVQQEGSADRVLGSIGRAGGWGAGIVEAAAQELVNGVALRAVECLEAAPVRPGRYPVILDPAAAGALIHRTVAHLARPALPGTDPDVLPVGTRLGPEILTMGDDPTAPGLPASAPFDDEGTITRRCTIIQNGVVLAHLHSRETAGASGQTPTGHARAGTLRSPPYPRASNSFLAPGKGGGSRDDLLAGIKRGIYLMDAIGCEASEVGVALRAGGARMIRDGRLAEPVKGVKLTGDLPGLLERVEGLGDPDDFRWSEGIARCRDGVAGSVLVTTGAPHLRIREAEIESEIA